VSARILCCGPDQGCPVCGATAAPCVWRPDAGRHTCFGTPNNGRFQEVKQHLNSSREYRLKHGHDESDGGKPVLTLASDVTPRPVEWVWTGRLERGAFNVVAGAQGAGKGVLTCAMAAHITRGTPWPDEPGQQRRPGSVIFVSAEDSVERTIVPRLHAAGADLSRVGILRHVEFDGHRQRFTLQTGLSALRAAIEQLPDVQAVFIDPLNSYLGGEVNTNAAEDIRDRLEPIIEAAEAANVAVIGLKHFSKPARGGGRVEAIYRIAGSSAFTEVPRTCHVVAVSPDAPSTLLLCAVKVSNARRPAPLAFAIQDVDGYPVAAWGGDVPDVDATELLAGGGGRRAATTDRISDVLKLFRQHDAILTAAQVAESLAVSDAAARNWLRV
jgi:hypothetical protein